LAVAHTDTRPLVRGQPTG